MFGDSGVSQYAITVDVCGFTLADLYGYGCDGSGCNKLMQYSTVEIDGTVNCPLRYNSENDQLNLIDFIRENAVIISIILIVLFLFNAIYYNMAYLKDRGSMFMKGKYGLVENSSTEMISTHINSNNNQVNKIDESEVEENQPTHKDSQIQPNLTSLYENLDDVDKESNIEFNQKNDFIDELNE
jgi:hypothetical protein